MTVQPKLRTLALTARPADLFDRLLNADTEHYVALGQRVANLLLGGEDFGSQVALDAAFGLEARIVDHAPEVEVRAHRVLEVEELALLLKHVRHVNDWKANVYDSGSDDVDPDDRHDWHSLVYGFMLGRGIETEEAKKLAFIVNNVLKDLT